MRIRAEPGWATARGILPSCDTWHSTSCRSMAQRRRCAASFSEPGGTTPISLASSPCSEVRLPWAGLIATELIVRRRAHRILVVCPPGPLLRQWEQEMRVRFGLRFTPIADGTSLREARRGLELGGNPFDATALCLTSVDFAKQDHVLAELERVPWDLVIIDE